MLSHVTGTKIYKFFAKIAAKRLSRLDGVLGVYGRTSLASGEIVFGKSDIDLAILIEDFDRGKEEANFIHHLCDTYLHIRKILPMIGECDIFNHFDIQAWNCFNTYAWFADRNWIRLYGEKINPLQIRMNKEDAIFKFIWWIFNFLFKQYRKKRTRSCFNILLELANSYYTYIGTFDKPKLKREHVLNYLMETNPWCKELRVLQRTFYRGLRGGNYNRLNRWIYQECLRLCDKLYDRVSRKLEGEVKFSDQLSFSPDGLFHSKYIVVKSLDGKEIKNGLDFMEKNQGARLITDKLLNLYLYYCNPWEYYTIVRTNGPFGLLEPPAEAVQGSILRQANKMLLRYVGFINARYGLLHIRICRWRLYMDYGFICKNKDELREVYKSRYGYWPFRKHTSRSFYFAHDYPILLEIIDSIYKSEIFSRAMKRAENCG